MLFANCKYGCGAANYCYDHFIYVFRCYYAALLPRRGRILRRTLSVCPSVPLLDEVFFYFTVEPSYERTSKIEKLRFSLMGQRHVCTFRHAQRAAYRTAISAAQILVCLIVI